VIFVLQQIDLREPTEIDVIYRHLQDTANATAADSSRPIAVSARKALLARTAFGQEKTLGRERFRALEEQINFIVTKSTTQC